MWIFLILLSRVYGFAQNVSTMKYCSTLEIVCVHFREDFENFIHELCFFTTKYALYLFLFLQVQSIKPKSRAFHSKLISISTIKFQLCHAIAILDFSLKLGLKLSHLIFLFWYYLFASFFDCSQSLYIIALPTIAIVLSVAIRRKRIVYFTFCCMGDNYC